MVPHHRHVRAIPASAAESPIPCLVAAGYPINPFEAPRHSFFGAQQFQLEYLHEYTFRNHGLCDSKGVTGMPSSRWDNIELPQPGVGELQELKVVGKLAGAPAAAAEKQQVQVVAEVAAGAQKQELQLVGTLVGSPSAGAEKQELQALAKCAGGCLGLPVAWRRCMRDHVAGGGARPRRPGTDGLLLDLL
jgi:hypothetical protein